MFLLPYIFYTIYIRLLGYEPYDAATQYWGQFIWVYYYFINIVKHSGEWYCQTIPENFICYFKDTLKTLYYLGLPILFSVFNFQLFKKIKNCKTKKFEINLSLIVIVLFIFWSFIGWYPPLRFNLYSIGNGLILVLTMQYLYLNKLNEKIFFLASLIFYFLFLNHWNFENVIYFHPAYLLSAISMIIFIIISYRNFDSNVNEDERFFYKNSDLYKLYQNSPYRSVKHSGYFQVYEQIFRNFIDSKFTFVEVGIHNGGSLFMWREFFGKDARIIGIDLNPKAKQFEKYGFEIFIGDQSSKKFWSNFYNEVGNIDILLDDGGHTYEQQIVSVVSSIDFINNNGMIVVEDTHTSYFKKFGYPSKHTFINWAKKLIDNINSRSEDVTVQNQFSKT